MFHFATLYSGSSGNCSAVWDDDALLLVDLGGSCRRALNGLYALGLSAAQVSGVLITHEHTDHIGAVPVFCRHYDTQLFGTRETRHFLEDHGMVAPAQRFEDIASDASFELGGFRVTPFATCHDSLSCNGYRIEKGGSALAVATDLGQMTDGVFAHLAGCRAVALEANYDEQMLRDGPYPAQLQARIRSPFGHLSNRSCAGAAVQLAQEGTDRLMLMHLSAENNAPPVALTECACAFENAGIGERCRVAAAPRYERSEVWEV